MDFTLINQAKALAAEIEAHNQAYYVRGQSTISDTEYDALLKELRDLETQIGKPLPGSPTQRVGSDLSGAFAKVKHSAPMLSLENVFTVEEAIKWFGSKPEKRNDSGVGIEGGLEVVVEAKIDGCAVELRYENGLFTQAITRGDGSTGDDVTANVRTIRAVPMRLPTAMDLRVRGEVYLRRSTFNQLNEERAQADEELLANPRNAAAGTLKQKSPAEVARRGLSFIAYAASLPTEFTQQTMTAELMRLGFPTLLTGPMLPEQLGDTEPGESEYEATTPLLFSAQLNDALDLTNAILNIEAQRNDLDFDIDGAVIKLNSRALQQELGNKTKAPAWACAFKFPPERKATTLLNIVVTVGRTGQCTPNARLSPVSLGGTMVENASLMNADQLVEIGSPAIGDIVWVEKSAEIIPRCVGVKERCGSTPWQFPAACECGISLERRGVHWFCNNPACPERVYQRIKHATSKGALDWDGMGEAQVRQIIDVGQELRQRGLLLSDLFTLNPAQLGLKTAAQKKFLTERERVKTTPLWRKLVSLGIEHVGQTLSKELAAKYGSLNSIVDACVAYKEGFAAGNIPVDNIRDLMGPVALDSLIEGLQTQNDDIATLMGLGFSFEDAGRSNLPLAGKVFCITGVLMSGTRDSVVDRIEAKGGIVKGSVGRKTHFLVTGENPGGSKTEDAKKYSTPTISEDQLYELLGEPMPKASLPDFDAV